MAKGSHATLAGWEPRTCCICTQPVLVSKQALRFNFNDHTGTVLAWHVDCEQPGWPHLKEEPCSQPSAT